MSVDVTKLPSGLTVVTDTMPHLETAALGVWTGVGGRDEKPNEHGISHLLEHMAFKGTTRRSSREIVEEIEAVGGDLNAGTSTETTAYYARVMKADVSLALDVLSDILANPTFVPDELEREKSVIVQEIGAAQDTPDDVVFEHLNELCYPDQPMGRSLLGTAKTLKAFNRDTLRGYLTTHYRGPEMVVAAAGAVDHQRIVEDVQRRFASFDSTPAPKPQPAMFGKGGSRVVHRDLEQAHLTLALEGLPQSDPSLFSLQVFTNILGGGMSSRLFQEVREKRGLCYSSYTFHAPYTDTGADEGRAVDGAGELQLPRRATGTSYACVWPSAHGGGVDDQDRRRQRGIDPQRGAGPAVAQQAGGGGAGHRPGSGHGSGFCGRIDRLEGQGAPALKAAPASCIREAQPWPCFGCHRVHRRRSRRAVMGCCCARRRCRISPNGLSCAITAGRI